MTDPEQRAREALAAEGRYTCIRCHAPTDNDSDLCDDCLGDHLAGAGKPISEPDFSGYYEAL